MKKHIPGAVITAVIVLFTLYALLDTFVISREMGVADAENYDRSLFESGSRGSDDTDPGQPDEESRYFTSEPVITDSSYSDEHIYIKIDTVRIYDTAVYVADVRVSSAEYLKTALAKDRYGRNITDETSDIAKAHNAILAVNGDFYGARERGYVIRNGVLYRSGSGRNEDLVIYPDGSFQIINERSTTAKSLEEANAWQVLSFGPALVTGGEISVGKNEEVAQSMASNPRTAIGIVDDLHYLFIVSDGRTSESAGLSLYELAMYMQSLGATTAYNLDGGGSSAMYFCGKILNNPTTSGSTISERSVSDIVYIG